MLGIPKFSATAMNINFFKYIIWSAIALLLSISFILVVFFLYNFSSQPISNNIEDWSSFGSFLTPVIGVLNTVLLGLITILISSVQQEKDKFDRRDRIYQVLLNNNHQVTKLLVEKDVNDLTKEELNLESIKITQFLTAYSNEIEDLELVDDGQELINSINGSIDKFIRFKDKEIVAEEAREHIWNFLEVMIDFESNFRKKIINNRYA